MEAQEGPRQVNCTWAVDAEEGWPQGDPILLCDLPLCRCKAPGTKHGGRSLEGKEWELEVIGKAPVHPSSASSWPGEVLTSRTLSFLIYKME